MAPLKCIAFSVLQSLFILQSQAYAVNPSPPEITEAPNYNVKLEARQNAQVICSQWSLVGGGQPACGAGLTCIFENGGYAEGCYDSTTDLTFQTACYDYPTTWNGVGSDPVSTFFCPSSEPYCGQYLFIDSASDTYTNLGCSASPYVITAFQISAFTTEASSSPNLVTIPASSNSFPTSTPSTDVFVLTTSPTKPIVGPGPTTNPGPSMSSSAASSTTTTPPTPTPDPAPKSNAAVIGGAVGGSIGGIALVIGAILLFCCIKRRSDRGVDAGKEPGISAAPGGGPAMSYASPAQQYEPVPQFSQTPKYDAGAFHGGDPNFGPGQQGTDMGAPQRGSAGWANNPHC